MQIDRRGEGSEAKNELSPIHLDCNKQDPAWFEETEKECHRLVFTVDVRVEYASRHYASLEK